MNTKLTLSPILALEMEQNDFVSTDTPLFEKRTVVELSDAELMDINGGSTPATVSSGWCIGSAIAVTVFVASAVYGYFSN